MNGNKGTTYDLQPSEYKDFFSHCYFRYYNICGPAGSGKTSVLEEASRYFHPSGKTRCEDQAIQTHPLIRLDFSDFASKTYSDALSYFRKKISDLYLIHWESYEESLVHRFFCSDYLDLLEGVSTDKNLSGSLKKMADILHRPVNANSFSRRSFIIIDEISMPLLYAAEYGYLDDMKAFYDRFLWIDHDEHTAGMLTSSYAPAGTEVSYYLKYLVNIPMSEVLSPQNSAPYGSRDPKYSNKRIGLKECFHHLLSETDRPDPVSGDCRILLPADVKKRISEIREELAAEQAALQKQSREYNEQERLHYLESLSPDCDLNSTFAGVRELRMDVTDMEKYRKLNGVLKGLYKLYGESATQKNVYQSIQRINKEMSVENVENVHTVITTLKKHAEIQDNVARYRINFDDRHWGRISVERAEDKEGFEDFALVKTYLSVIDEHRIAEVFESVVRHLIDEGKHRFHAKVGMDVRDDQICLWVSRDDFFSLEQHMKQYDELLYTPLCFVAYRGKLGISREFYSCNSHNSVQALLISEYIKYTESSEQIDLLDMYSTYVKAWNGDLESKHPFTLAFKHSNAQELLILLESLNIILGNEEIDDENILLNGDSFFWQQLGSSKNWHEVSEALKTGFRSHSS